ncbi:MAG: molybdopterin-dependent oxidoreductase [Nitrospinae bacterium]|nr:molybdopterin-dependent oxidoreductase [Nitrospinota bacterium]
MVGTEADADNGEDAGAAYVYRRDEGGVDNWGQVTKITASDGAAEDLFGFPRVSQVSRLKCVECWSAKARWEGFRFQELVDRAQPDPEAKYVTFQSADSYYESYMLEELLRPRVLMVLRMNNQPLSKDHGFPLRLIAPFKYGYKNVKYITQITFTDSRKRNYWADYGPYSVDGTIQPGIDHPLDFNKKPLPINGGEVFHPFDSRPAAPKTRQ